MATEYQGPAVPRRLSRFIGRRSELATLRRLLGHTRLLTVLGPGGAGKTRLATEFARQQAVKFRDGQALVELAAVHDPQLVDAAVARAVGLMVRGQDTPGAVTRRLRDRQLLLVLDNCEHLLESAAEVVTRLLTNCPDLTVLATSRERLNVEGETSWQLPPLALPDATASVDVAAATDAVRLFVDRARSARPAFDLTTAVTATVVAICRRLDGIPLGIELAAARTATMSPAEIMARLDSRLQLLTRGARSADSRHQTLRATLDWSYQLLDAAERTLLQRLSVFEGAFRFDAAEEVCTFAPLDASGVFDGLQRLADKSMVQASFAAEEPARHRLLDTVREYAADALEQAGGSAELAERHLALYERLAAEAFEARLTRGAMPEHHRLWAEMADVRAAIGRAARQPERELALLANLRHLWTIYAPAEGQRRLAAALDAYPRTASRPYARAQWVFHALLGRGPDRRFRLTPAELGELYREAGEQTMAPTAMLGAGYKAERTDRDLDLAYDQLCAAVHGLEQVGNLPDMAMALSSIGCVEMQRGNLRAARPWIQRSLEVAVAVEDDYGAIGAHYTRGWLEVLCGDLEAARAEFVSALDLVAGNDVLSIAQQAEGIAETQRGADPARALTLYGAASRLRDEVERPVMLPWSIWVEPGIAATRAALPDIAADRAWTTGQKMRPDDVLALARAAAEPASTSRRVGRRGLSKREFQVARLVADGLRNRDIAERLFLSERTVESHLDHILGKLGFHSRAQVAAWVAQQPPDVEPR